MALSKPEVISSELGWTEVGGGGSKYDSKYENKRHDERWLSEVE